MKTKSNKNLKAAKEIQQVLENDSNLIEIRKAIELNLYPQILNTGDRCSAMITKNSTSDFLKMLYDRQEMLVLDVLKKHNINPIHIDDYIITF